MSLPNVILLTVDTVRADVLGCYGSPQGLTPNLDRLAGHGICFKQAISGGSWTQAALPVILTSSSASLYGGCIAALAPERPSPVERLQGYGYDTVAITTNPHLSRRTDYDRGFNHFRELIPNEDDPALRDIWGGQRLLRNATFQRVSGRLGLQLRPRRVYSPAEDVTSAVIERLGQARAPFFLWAHYMDAHWPYHLDRSAADAGKRAMEWQDLAVMHKRASFRREAEITVAYRDRFRRLYEEAIRYLDHEIGRLLTHIEGARHLDNTIIVVVSDHGEEFLEHGRWGHWESNLHDEIVRVPFIMRLPRRLQAAVRQNCFQTTPRVIERQVRTLDLMPTILDLCACPLPQKVEGASLVPLWREDGGAGEGYAVTEALSEMHRPPWHRIAVRSERFKLIWDSKQPAAPELYDLSADPGELRDASKAFPDVVDVFMARIERHLQEMAATEPTEAPGALELDAATRRRLHALGYVD